MLDSGIDVQLAARQADTSDMVRFKRQMDGLKQRLAGDADQNQAKELRQACEKFEAVFISKLWQEMRKTVPKEGYLHGKQEEQYLSMFDRDFAEKMASSGGIGLADMIYDQLSEKLKNTSRTTLEGGVPIKPLHGEESIALNQSQEPIALKEKPAGMTLEQWGGQRQEGDGSVAETASAAPAEERSLSDVEVKARLETLVRHLESERIKTGLLGSGEAAGAYGRKSGGNAGQIGREIAKNG